jgi:serine/threonine-protein kinase
VSFPFGLDICPNDGERLLTTPSPPSRDQGPVDATESLAQGSDVAGPADPTASLVDEFAGSDLTRAERPSARGRSSSVSRSRTGTTGSRRRRRPATRRPEERIGELLGNYKILDLLGRGGMGCVYQAEHVKLGRRVALKLLRDDHAQRRDAVARFFQEARSVNRIRHRNIVDVTDFVELDDGPTFLVMELLTGTSMGRLMRSGQLEAPRALALLIQICDGLAAAHAMGIVHRDLKPDNIFVVPTGDGADLVKLLDFGVAKLLWRDDEDNEEYGFETAAGAVVGTPTYMSPEQAGGLSVDARSDIYSLGAIMYELFTGQPIFRGKSFGEFVRKHLNDTPVPPSATPGGRLMDDRLEAIILRCLEKRADDRYQAIGDLRQDLMALLGAVETSIPLSVADLVAVSTGGHGSSDRASVDTAQSSALTAPELGALGTTNATRSTYGDRTQPPTGRRTGTGRAPLPAPVSPAAPVPETAMTMGDLPVGQRTGERRGRGALWIGLGLLAAGAAGAAVVLATRGGDDDRAETRPASQPATGPMVSSVPDDEALPATGAGPRRPFTVRFIAHPSAQVFDAGGVTPLCTTPCDVTVDPGGEGPLDHRAYDVRRDGYRDERIQIDLDRPKRTVELDLSRLRRGSRPTARRPRPTTPPEPATPIADKTDPPVVQPDPPPKPKPKPKPKPRPGGKIDPSDTLDPFGNR